MVCGRKSGKSFMMALVAVDLAVFRDYRPYLQRGQRATIMIVAQDRAAARNNVDFVNGLLRGSPMLACMIQRETRETFELSNSVRIKIQTAARAPLASPLPRMAAGESNVFETAIEPSPQAALCVRAS